MKFTTEKLIPLFYLKWPGGDLTRTMAEIDGHAPYNWKPEAWLELDQFADDYSLSTLALLTKEIIGLVLYKLVESEGLAHLIKIYIKPQYQCRGYGHGLLQFSIQSLIGQGYGIFYLEVAEDNYSAQALYQKTGFLSVRNIKDLYGSGRDAVAYRLASCQI